MKTEHAVVIAGGGPTGLMLAGELKLAGADVAIVERRETQELAGTRAGGLHARTLEVLDQRGIAERFLREGQTMQVAGFAMILLDIGDFPTRHPYGLALTQNHIERILAGWVAELSVPIYRGCEVTGFAQDDGGVYVQLADGRTLHAQYLVGCDGGRSIVRRRAGIAFAGWDASVSYLIAEAQMTGAPDNDIRHGANGINAIGKMEDGKRTRVVLIEPNEPSAGHSVEPSAGFTVEPQHRHAVEPSAGDTVEPQHRHSVEPTVDDLRAALVGVYGSDFDVRDVTWLSRFSDMARQAAQYRERRVLLAGDAAHVHAPTGGQGLNIGVQDAVNLGWKLAQVVRGVSPPSLLDTYHAERHPLAARVLKLTLAQVALMRGDERTMALREDVATLLAMAEPRKRYGALMSGLDIRYDLGRSDIQAQHPLLGRRMPDLEVVTESGTLRVFKLLRECRPVLLNFGEPKRFGLAPWADRVQLLDARFQGEWELPVLGEVPAPRAVLVRPDGYVAWIGDESRTGLADALTTWFGEPRAA